MSSGFQNGWEVEAEVRKNVYSVRSSRVAG
jgi:hypothetical protein